MLTLAIACTLAGVACTAVLMPGIAQAQEPAETSAEREYAIGPGALSDVLAEFSAMAGVQLVFDPQMLAGLQSPGLQGRHSVQEGFSQLLQGSGYRLVAEGNGAYSLREIPAGARTLPPVRITGTTVADGSVESGYVSKEVSQVGPWQGRSLQDTPYSINVVPEALINNLQATSTDQVFRINPVIQMVRPQRFYDLPYINLRGFNIPEFAHNGVSRVRGNYSTGTMTEEVGRIEVLTGLSGFLYGAGNVGGMVNFVTKRPTKERLNNVTFGNTSGENIYLHGDFGGQFDRDSTFGYRVNLVTQGGDTYVDRQSLDRDSISAAFDWQATDRLLFTLDWAQRDFEQHGQQPSLVPIGVDSLDADDLDPTRNYGQEWSATTIESERIEVGAHWQISSNLAFRSRYLSDYSKETYTQVLFNAIQSTNSYDQTVRKGAPQRYYGKGSFAYLDFDFSTGSITHKLTAGGRYSDAYRKTWRDPYSNSVVFSNISLSNPQYFPEPEWSSHGTEPARSSTSRSRTLTLGDDIAFNSNWSALVGISRSHIINSTYDKSDTTPTLSLIYKPSENISTYASYIEALEQGGTARDDHSGLPVSNAGEVMEPLNSEQVEIGVKASLGNLLLTASLYEIDKALEYYEVNGSQARFVQDGRQVHKGLEFTATGSITDNLTLVGGFSLMDAKVEENEQSPELEGKTPINVAEKMIKVYLEYDFPAISGLTLNSGMSYTGEYYGDATNSKALDGFTLLDIGARYQTSITNSNKLLTLKFNINNLTDERYWLSYALLGEGRTVSLSASLQF